MKPNLSLSALLGILTWSTRALAYDQTVDLGTLGGAFSQALDLNEGGQVVGTSTRADGQTRAFLWDKGVMIDLGPGEARAVNTKGQAVGDHFISFEHNVLRFDSYIYEVGKTTVLPPLPGDTFTQAFDINDAGVVVGSSNGVAVVWTNGVPSPIGTLGGRYSTAKSINNKGWVAGSSRTADGSEHAFLFRDGVMIDLGALGEGDTSAYAINELGQVVGESSGRGFIWENGFMKDLGSNGFNSKAFDINEKGLISGEGDHWARDYPIVWTTYHSIQELTLLSGALWAESNAINDAGVVVGSTTYGSPGDHVAPSGTRATLWK